MSSTAWQEWFERVWADREERILPQLFGPSSRGIFTLTPATFEPFKQPSLDLRWLILAPPVSFESEFALESGWVELHEAFGATEDEAGYARKHGGDKLVEILTRAGAFPVTDPRRHSAVLADPTGQ